MIVNTAEFDIASSDDLIEDRLIKDLGIPAQDAGPDDILQSCALSVRDALSSRWVRTQARDGRSKARRAYYLSMEFLMGRTLSNALAATGFDAPIAKELAHFSVALEDVAEHERDAALGSGGLGRLAACFLDSMATLGMPSFGYGIRYEHGMFLQQIRAGAQAEVPDSWLVHGTPWEFARHDAHYPIRFGGHVERIEDTDDERSVWMPSGEVLAKAYDMVIPGHGTDRVSTLRLWKAVAPQQIDLAAFNAGDFSKAIASKDEFENLSWVLYPSDSTAAGRALRLRQEYFLASASVQDIVARHVGEHGDVHNLAQFVAIHLNDTHPAIAVPEMMRLLCDEFDMTWDDAWEQSSQVFSYTNHTLMPEALETWPVSMMERLLPRHMEIIYRINTEHLQRVRSLRPGDDGLLSRMSLIDEHGERRVRMAHLAIVGSHKVNGVSALHSQLLVETLFADFAALWPNRFISVTNGITPRRWLQQANPGLANLLDQSIGSTWRRDLNELSRLLVLQDDEEFQGQFLGVKLSNKRRLADWIERVTGTTIDPTSLFDVQVKRIHEYKRQLLNVMHVVWRYQQMLRHPEGLNGVAWVPRTVIFAGKAASSYQLAKSIIHLINDVGGVINNDPRIGGKLKVVFIPNYGVSAAELIMPAADLSEQISTAGTEASGTGNMKLALNGALTIGTRDGANIEILEQVGEFNMFIFGLQADQVLSMRDRGYNSKALYEQDAELRAVIDAIGDGSFSPEEPRRYERLVDSLLGLGGDNYMLLADFPAYVKAQMAVDALYASPNRWARKAIANVAGMGPFSSDRTIEQYATQIWNVHTEPIAG